ncbi:MAG: helix-turn-helix domain-containing protein [Peptococcaceae bacterium]
MLIGKTLKRLRVEKKLSIRDLAAKTELSPAALSNIERDINSPTLASLAKICEALDIHMVDLLQLNENDDKEKILFKKSERKTLEISGESNIKYELISNPKNNFKLLAITMDPECNYGYISQSFPSDEIALVIRGTMELMLEEELYLLEEGDTIYLKAGSRYQYRNAGTETCLSIWAVQGINKLETLLEME